MLVSLWETWAEFHGVDAGSLQLAHVLIARAQLMCRLVYIDVLPSGVRGTKYELPVFLLTLLISLRGKEHTYVRTVNVSVVYT
jgi:hypothetical protein